MTINTAMLVALGFLIATLLAVLIAPAYRRRTVRLTTDAMKRTLPLTEAEMRADKDRLRADHAIRIHNLESKLESVTLSSARQKIEMNRRDARISELEGANGQQASRIEEFENARRVLEQTLTDRLPKIEARLEEARRLLVQRDGEVVKLADTAQTQARAIAEANQINVQQTAEIDRLTAALSTRAARNADALDSRFDGEIALRSEIDALRAKTRDQSALIQTLQGLVANVQNSASNLASPLAARAEVVHLRGELDGVQSGLEAQRDSAKAMSEGAKLGSDGASLESDGAQALRSINAVAEADLRRLRTANQDMTAELARLKAQLAAFEHQDSGVRMKESPIAMKARLAALEAQTAEQATTIASLRAEAAASAENLARQAAHYMEEMKRLGAGTLPASGEARKSRAEAVKRTLTDRINDPRVVRLTPLAEKKAGTDVQGSTETDPPPAANGGLFYRNPSAPVPEPTPAPGVGPASAATAPPPSPAPRRPRLLERITQIDKPGSN
jgi:uncharacterized coiled-coil protein SlyX